MEYKYKSRQKISHVFLLRDTLPNSPSLLMELLLDIIVSGIITKITMYLTIPTQADTNNICWGYFNVSDSQNENQITGAVYADTIFSQITALTEIAGLNVDHTLFQPVVYILGATTHKIVWNLRKEVLAGTTLIFRQLIASVNGGNIDSTGTATIDRAILIEQEVY